MNLCKCKYEIWLENIAYKLEFNFNHSTAMNFSSFGSWKLQIEPQKASMEEMQEKRDIREKREKVKIIFLIWSNEPKVLCIDVISSFYRAKFTLIFLCLRKVSLTLMDYKLLILIFMPLDLYSLRRMVNSLWLVSIHSKVFNSLCSLSWNASPLRRILYQF